MEVVKSQEKYQSRQQRRKRLVRKAGVAALSFAMLNSVPGDAKTIFERTPTIEAFEPDAQDVQHARETFPMRRNVIFQETGVDRTALFALNLRESLTQYASIDLVHLNESHSDPVAIARILAHRYAAEGSTEKQPMTLYFYGSSVGGVMAHLVAQHLKESSPHTRVEVLVADSSPASMDDVYLCNKPITSDDDTQYSLRNNQMVHTDCTSYDKYRQLAFEYRATLKYVPDEMVRYIGRIGIRNGNKDMAQLADKSFVHISKQLQMLESFDASAKPIDVTFGYIAGKNDRLVNTFTAVDGWSKHIPTYKVFRFDQAHAQCVYPDQRANCTTAILTTHALNRSPRVEDQYYGPGLPKDPLYAKLASDNLPQPFDPLIDRRQR